MALGRVPPELLVLRHAKSAWDTGAPSDFERPLAPRGRRDARRMGRWLRDRGLVPDVVLSSPARRAAQTVKRIAKALDLAEERIRFDERIYMAEATTLLEVIASTPEGCQRLLLVGHNPGLEDLVAELAGGTLPLPPGAKAFPTAALAYFRDGSLVEVVRPRELEPASA